MIFVWWPLTFEKAAPSALTVWGPPVLQVLFALAAIKFNDWVKRKQDLDARRIVALAVLITHLREAKRLVGVLKTAEMWMSRINMAGTVADLERRREQWLVRANEARLHYAAAWNEACLAAEQAGIPSSNGSTLGEVVYEWSQEAESTGRFDAYVDAVRMLRNSKKPVLQWPPADPGSAADNSANEQ